MMHDDVLRRVTELLSFNSYAVRKRSSNFSWQVLQFKQQTANGQQYHVWIFWELEFRHISPKIQRC